MDQHRRKEKRLHLILALFYSTVNNCVVGWATEPVDATGIVAQWEHIESEVEKDFGLENEYRDIAASRTGRECTLA